MKVIYDAATDALAVIFSDAPVAESDQDAAGVILDYDASSNLVSLEILDASRYIGSLSWTGDRDATLPGASGAVDEAFVEQVAAFIEKYRPALDALA